MLRNLLFLISGIIAIFPFLSPKSVYDVDYYFDQNGEKVQRGRISIIRFVLKQLTAIFQDVVVSLIVSLTLQGSVTLLIFLVVGVDLYFRKSLSTESVIVTVIGVIALYMNQLVSSASELEFFRGLFRYKSKRTGR